MGCPAWRDTATVGQPTVPYGRGRAARLRAVHAQGMVRPRGQPYTPLTIFWHAAPAAKEYLVNTLYGPHMMQVPTAFVPQLRQWQPPVCLLLLDVLHDLDLSDSEPRLAALSQMTVTELEGHIQATIRDHVQPFQAHSELHATKVIGRLFMPDHLVAAHIERNPVQAAQFHHRLVLAARNILGVTLQNQVHCWIVVNEVLAHPHEKLQKLDTYETKRMALAGTTYGCGLYGFPTWHPSLVATAESTAAAQLEVGAKKEYDTTMGCQHGNTLWWWNQLAISLQHANTHNRRQTSAPPHVLLLHQYFKPDQDHDHAWVRADGTISAFNQRKNVRRFEHHVYAWFKQTYPHLKVIVSEYGADGRIAAESPLGDWGWQHYEHWRGDNAAGENRYLAALKDLEIQNRAQADVILGYCLFGLGDNGSDEFDTYRIDGTDGILHELVAHAQTLQTPSLIDTRPTGDRGTSLNQAEHRSGAYTLTRDGDTVHATFTSASSPVQYFARADQGRAPVFRIAALRPTEQVTLSTGTTQAVNRDGSPKPGNIPCTLKLEVHTDGNVYYVDEGVRAIGYLQYSVSGSWSLTEEN